MNCTKRIVFIMFAIICLTSCHIIDSECRNMQGCYVTNTTEHYDDGISCNVQLKTTENFNTFSFCNNVEMKATFIMDETWNFPNLTLTYNISIKGDWDYAENTLIVSVDTTTFQCDYVGTSAKTPTEESMARQIRKNVIAGELMPRIRKEIIESAERKVRVIQKDEKQMIVEHPISKLPITMIKVK